MNAAGMGSHERPREGETNDWLTPPEIIQTLGPFDLDPCASVNQPWRTAIRQLDPAHHDGLTMPWFDSEFVWCNPPYGPHAWDWLAKLADHPAGGIALIFARTEVAGFKAHVWGRASSILFIGHRLRFYRAGGQLEMRSNAGAPSCLVAYGEEADRRLLTRAHPMIDGTIVTEWGKPTASSVDDYDEQIRQFKLEFAAKARSWCPPYSCLGLPGCDGVRCTAPRTQHSLLATGRIKTTPKG